MHFQRSAAAVAAALSIASAETIRGFNTGSTGADGSAKQQSDFQAEFSNQKNIDGSDGQFNSARLYTMIQDGTTASPISAIPAAIAENTGLLLGLWASAGQASFNNELAALQASISQYGSQLGDLAQGISVGSEDLYRISVTGIANSDGLPGASPDVVASYISQVRKAVAGTALAHVPIGHVDTWNAWTNGSNSAVIDACDFIGVDEYPYYQSQDSNGISNEKSLFDAAIQATQAAAGSKPIWITESGYPSSGPTVGAAVASVANAHQYWLDVYCTLPASTPIYWYIQYQAAGTNTANFGLTGTSLSTTPIFDLSCAAAKNTTTSGSTSSSSSATKSSHVSATGTATGQATGLATDSSSLTSKTSSSSVRVGADSTSSSSAAATQTSSSALLTSSAATLITTTTPTSPTGTATSTPTPLQPSNDASSNIQVYTLALLIVPAVLAFMM